MVQSGEPLRLIDVREPFELQLGHLEDAEAIPMRSIPSRLASLEEEERPIVVLCHHGVRSLQVVCWLREQGVEECRSLAGGIDRWSVEVDPAVPRY
ncbi:MAG: Rhodanese domain protein [Bryobacterales bacterium]|nr:Rhodanese domain protein [Bryobacterales bacterium]